MTIKIIDLDGGKRAAWDLIFFYEQDHGVLKEEDFQDCARILREALEDGEKDGLLYVAGFFHYLALKKPQILKYFIPCTSGIKNTQQEKEYTTTKEI